MPPWLLALPSRIWGYAATAAAAVGAFLWFWLSAKRAGRKEAEADALGRNLQAMEKADEAGAAYRGDGAGKRLRDGTF